VNQQSMPNRKKEYKEPHLRVYGDLQVLTQAVNMVAGQIDNGMAKKTN